MPAQYVDVSDLLAQDVVVSDKLVISPKSEFKADRYKQCFASRDENTGLWTVSFCEGFVEPLFDFFNRKSQILDGAYAFQRLQDVFEERVNTVKDANGKILRIVREGDRPYMDDDETIYEVEPFLGGDFHYSRFDRRAQLLSASSSLGGPN